MTRVLTVILLALASSACDGDRQRCVLTEDCFRGEICAADGFCALPSEGVDAGADTGGSSETSGDSSAASDSSSIPDTGRDRDDGAPSPDMSTDGLKDLSEAPDAAPDALLPACFADPFVSCEDPENDNNNSFPGETVTTMTRGCQPSGFVPLDITIDAVMCPLDPMDMYRFNFVECDADEPGFVIEAILDLKDDCDPNDVRFDFSGVLSGGCASTDPRVRCETLPDRRRRIQVLMPGDSSPVVGGIRFIVETPDRMDLRFDYSLQLIVRE